MYVDKVSEYGRMSRVCNNGVGRWQSTSDTPKLPSSLSSVAAATTAMGTALIRSSAVTRRVHDNDHRYNQSVVTAVYNTFISVVENDSCVIAVSVECVQLLRHVDTEWRYRDLRHTGCLGLQQKF